MGNVSGRKLSFFYQFVGGRFLFLDKFKYYPKQGDKIKKKKHLYKIIGGILAFAVVIGSGTLWIQGINGEYEAAFAKEQEEKET